MQREYLGALAPGLPIVSELNHGQPQAEAAVTLEDLRRSAALHQPALQQAGTISRYAVSDEQWKRRQGTLRDWQNWASMFPVCMRPSLKTCNPMDVISFLEDWRSSRTGRAPGMIVTEENQPVPIAPGTLRDCRSRLKILMELVDRSGNWTPQRTHGNPCDHVHVAGYLSGYEQYCFQLYDYAAAGAVPMKPTKMVSLRTYLLGLFQRHCKELRGLIVMRDLCAFQYLWETFQRGKECIRLKTTDFHFLNLQCTNAWPAILAGNRSDEPYPVVVESSMGTKTRKTKYPGVIHLLPAPQPQDVCGYLLQDLQLYGQTARALGIPLGQWMFPISDAAQLRLIDRPFAHTTSLNARLQIHLQAMDVWENETIYSFRRGQVQERLITGDSMEHIATQGLWRSPKTVSLYGHPLRHQARLPRRPSDQVSIHRPLLRALSDLFLHSRASPEDGGALALSQ